MPSTESCNKLFVGSRFVCLFDGDIHMTCTKSTVILVCSHYIFFFWGGGRGGGYHAWGVEYRHIIQLPVADNRI